MDLYLIPENPENTTFLSANGTAHFRVTTIDSLKGSVTYIQRPSDTLEAGLLAKICSQKGKKTTILNSTLLGSRTPDQDEQGVEASSFLYRKGRFDASSRYFIGNDGDEYRWKFQKNLGWTLTNCSTGDEVTQQIRWFSEEGIFAGEERAALRIYPCSVDIELVILSFILAEKKRRAGVKKLGEDKSLYVDEEPSEGGTEGTEAEASTGTYGEM